MGETAAGIERRLDAGEWLRPGEVAIVLGVDRRTIDRMLRSNLLRYRIRPGVGRYRETHPADVRRELDKRRAVHGEDAAAAPQITEQPPEA